MKTKFELMPEIIYMDLPLQSTLLRLKQACGRNKDDVYELPSMQLQELFCLLIVVQENYYSFDVTRCMVKARAEVIHGDRSYFDNILNSITRFKNNLKVNKMLPSLRYQIAGQFDPKKKDLLKQLKNASTYVSGISTLSNYTMGYVDDFIGVQDEVKCSYCNRKDCFDLYIEEACWENEPNFFDWYDIEPQEAD